MTLFAVWVTLVAGLATVVGALLVKRVRNTSFGAFSLSFATGIMLMVSLGEMLPEAMEKLAVIPGMLFLVFGSMLSLILDVVLPHHHHDEEDHDEVPGHYINDCECAHENHVHSSMIVALLLHNILEGLATGVAVVSNSRLGINMAIGIAIHNIPIGTTLAVSMLSAKKTKGETILAAMLVGLSQPLGAILGTAVPASVLSESFLAVCNAIVAGILVFISFDELWPAARKSGSRNLTISALMIGICFVPLTELLV